MLQGFYQSHQATAAAVQVNNLHIVRGMLGGPGCGVLQMNGQPTAQNTRECGADGDLPGFRNWANDQHVQDLARVWNLDPKQIPHYSPPTHLMQMMRYAEDGSIRLLYVSCTNPAVSLPELRRVRSILSQERLFLVVLDIFLSETAQLADVVLPAATWGEKTGVFTNADRTVHLSEKAVDPPGEARPDLDIFIDYARRLGLQDKDGAPLVKWATPEEAFEAWKRCSAGRPCDYTGISYDRLRGGSGIQWPCTADAPDGTERLYADGEFWAAPDYCESYGRDLLTGAPLEPTEYRALNPFGKAVIRAAEYVPPHEPPSGEYPFALITGRTIYQFHTRTKTGRARQLQEAAPDAWVEASEQDARGHGWAEGDLLRVSSPRGQVEARLRIGRIRPGVVFLPFHYGYWDAPGGFEPSGGAGRAANELTVTIGTRPPSSRSSRRPRRAVSNKVPWALEELHRAENDLAEELLQASDRHKADHEIYHLARDLAQWSRQHVRELAAVGERYGISLDPEPEDDTTLLARLRQKGAELVGGRHEVAVILLKDLRTVHRKAAGVSLDWEILAQTAQALKDEHLLALAQECRPQTLRQLRWANAALKEHAAQVMVT